MKIVAEIQFEILELCKNIILLFLKIIFTKYNCYRNISLLGFN